MYGSSGAPRTRSVGPCSTTLPCRITTVSQELGAAGGTSNATVVRALQRLGYAGLPAPKRELAADFTSALAPEVRLQQRIAHVGQDLEGIWIDVFDETPSGGSDAGPVSSARPASPSPTRCSPSDRATPSSSSGRGAGSPN